MLVNKVKIISGYHITATERKALNALFSQQIFEGRIGRTNYKIEKIEGNRYNFYIAKKWGDWQSYDPTPKMRVEKLEIEVSFKQ